MYACVLIHFSPVQHFATLWTVAHQAPLRMGFSRQEYLNELPYPPLRNLPRAPPYPVITGPWLYFFFFKIFFF